MTKQAERANIVATKTALAEKYERRARNCKSKPAKARLEHQAERYRQQAANAQKIAGGSGS
jgi:hypothetical protein